MLAEIPEEQVRGVVEGVARATLAEGGVVRPPVDALQLAGRLGLVVARDGMAPDGISPTRARFVRVGGAGLAGQGTILLADEVRPERRQWAVAHEIGESRAAEVFAALGVDADEAAPSAREGVANRLAGCLLLPLEWFAADGAAVEWDLFDLKSIYVTASHELIARRMLEMASGVIITLADQGRRQWRLSNRHFRPPPLTPPELAAWQMAHERGVAARCDVGELPEGIEDVRAWPIHEEGWRREIVRTALAVEW